MWQGNSIQQLEGEETTVPGVRLYKLSLESFLNFTFFVLKKIPATIPFALSKNWK